MSEEQTIEDKIKMQEKQLNDIFNFCFRLLQRIDAETKERSILREQILTILDIADLTKKQKLRGVQHE